MRIATKAQRKQVLANIKENLTGKGYQLETFEGLQFFTKHDAELNRWYLQAYRDNSTKPILNYYYRDVESMNKRIEQTKENYKRVADYKAERKANKVSSPTLATLKAFLNKNSDNIFVKELSSFDGMVDCVMPINDEFSHVQRKEINDRDLGFAGCWLVGSSRDSISIYEDDKYTGFKVYNSCGSWIAATPKETKEVKEVSKPEIKQGSVNIIEYGKGIAVIGETYPIKDKLKAIGGRFNKFLTCGAGWVFSKDKFEEIKTMLLEDKKQKESASVNPIAESEPQETKEVILTNFKDVQTFTDLQELEEAAKGGQVISLLNMYDLVNQRKAIN